MMIIGVYWGWRPWIDDPQSSWHFSNIHFFHQLHNWVIFAPPALSLEEILSFLLWVIHCDIIMWSINFLDFTIIFVFAINNLKNKGFPFPVISSSDTVAPSRARSISLVVRHHGWMLSSKTFLGCFTCIYLLAFTFQENWLPHLVFVFVPNRSDALNESQWQIWYVAA